MGQEGGDFFSRLLLYPVNQEEPSAQIELGSLTVLDLNYDKDLLWILCEDRLLTVSLTDEGTASVQTCRISPNYLKGCTLEGEGFALLLTGRYRSGGAEQALVVDSSAQVARSIPITGQVLDYSACGEYFALLTGSQLTIYDGQLEQFAALDYPRGARTIDLASNGSALLANDQEAWLFIPQQ